MPCYIFDKIEDMTKAMSRNVLLSKKKRELNSHEFNTSPLTHVFLFQNTNINSLSLIPFKIKFESNHVLSCNVSKHGVLCNLIFLFYIVGVELFTKPTCLKKKEKIYFASLNSRKSQIFLPQLRTRNSSSLIFQNRSLTSMVVSLGGFSFFFMFISAESYKNHRKIIK
jgi:hypothetical protein